MSDVRVAVERVVASGLAAAYTGSLSTANTYMIRNNGRVIIHLKKSAAVDCVATITTPMTIDGLAVAERTVTVPATTGDRFIGPFLPSLYNDVAQDVRITFSDIDGLTIAVLEI